MLTVEAVCMLLFFMDKQPPIGGDQSLFAAVFMKHDQETNITSSRLSVDRRTHDLLGVTKHNLSAPSPRSLESRGQTGN